METKKCRTCETTKPVDEFYRHPKSADGYMYECKDCNRARALRWATEHPDRHLEAMRRHAKTDQYKRTRQALRTRKRDQLRAQRQDWYGRNRDELNAKRRARRQNDPEFREAMNRRAREWTVKNRERRRQWQRQFLYGLMPEQFDALMATQQGRCAICRDSADLHVDHDHNAGHVRGLLCDRCNHGLGHFRDSPTFLRSAAEYLERAGSS